MDTMFRMGETKGIDEKERTITAYVSTDAIDRTNEAIDPEGVDMTKYKKNPVVLWAHDYTTPPIAKALWIKRDGAGILSKMQFASTPFAQEIFDLYKGGFLRAFSVGFIPKETAEGDGKKEARWTYTKSELLEYSAVPVPANPEALMLAMSKGMVKTPELKSFLEKALTTKPIAEVKEPEVKEEDKTVAVEKEVVIFDINETLDDLQAELSLTKERADALEVENQDLKVKLFEVLDKYKKNLSEMAVIDYTSKAQEIIDRAIRKHKGQIN